MTDDAKRLWRTGDEDAGREMPDAELLAMVKRRSARLERQVRRRDLLEIVAAGVVCVLFTPLLFDASWVTRAGVILFVLGSALILVRLHRARRGAPDPTAPLGRALRTERARVDAQIRLLESVLWWYIAPLALGVVLVFVGSEGLSWTSLTYTAVVLAGGVWIHRLNRRAARVELAPHREDLDRLLARLEDETS